MDLRSNKIGREKLRPGDHIYTWSSGYTYSHHGIYVGDGKVIHLTRGPGFIISSSSTSQPSNDPVVCCNIQDFLRDGQLYRFEYGVSRSGFLMNRPGTCSLAYSNPPEQVLHRASYLLEHGFGNYHLLNKNSEDFAFYCKTSFVKDFKTGDIYSWVVQLVVIAFVAVTVIPYRLLPAGLIGVALVVCGLYCFLRLSNDVGAKSRGCYVVAVEKLQDHVSEAHNKRETMNMMEKKTTRWFLSRIDYIRYAAVAIGLWYSTPESKLLAWLKSFLICVYLSGFVSEHLKLIGFKLGEYSAYTIWLLGYCYWRWRSVSTILLWTRFLSLSSFLGSFIHDHSRRLKFDKYISDSVWVLELWYWTPGSPFFQWVRFATLYQFLSAFLSDHLENHPMMSRAFFAYFGIQSAAIILELDYRDYIYRIREMISFLYLDAILL